MSGAEAAVWVAAIVVGGIVVMFVVGAIKDVMVAFAERGQTDTHAPSIAAITKRRNDSGAVPD